MSELLRENRQYLAPFALAVLLILGNIFFAVRIILPAWNTNRDLNTQVADGQAVAARAMQPTESETDLLQARVENSQADLDAAAQIFLSGDAADGILDRIYQYAAESMVEITALQLQPTTPLAADDSYEARIFVLEVQGITPYLMSFLIRIRELAAPGVVLNNLNIINNTLKMELRLYTSSFAPERDLADSPEPIIPVSLRISATPIPPTPMPSITPDPLVSATPIQPFAMSATPSAPIDTPTLSAITATPVPEAVTVGVGVYDDTHAAVQYTVGTWTEIASYSGYGGGYHYATEAGAEVRLTFLGTSVAVQYVAFRNFGIFEIYVDDTLVMEVDGYAERGVFGQLATVEGLPNGSHTLVIRSTDRRNEASEGTVIALDAVYVLEEQSQN